MKAYAVVGLGFGDEGKGATVDALVRRTHADTVVRFNGGGQAAHHVVTPEGHAHCFSQFGSGTFAGARTHLSRFVTVDAVGLYREAEALAAAGVMPWALLTVDPRCAVVTPYHRALNHLRELSRGAERHGSTGRGFGEVAAAQATGGPTLTVGLLASGDSPAIHARLSAVRDYCFSRAIALGVDPGLMTPWRVFQNTEAGEDWLYTARLALARTEVLPDDEARDDAETVVFEGAQGVLLDEWHGLHPHTTYSTTTFANAATLAEEWGAPLTRIGVTRAYATRHGAGPLPTEDADPALREAWARGEHNADGEWQGAFRYGHPDLVLLRYARDVVGPLDAVAVTCLDRVPVGQRVCAAYHPPNGWADEEVAEVDHHGHVVRLRPATADLAHQSRLTRLVAGCRPIYEPSSVPFLDRVTDAVGSPALRIVSRGPTCVDVHGAHVLEVDACAS